MRDKMLRAGATDGISERIVIAAKRARMAGDHEAISRIVDQMDGLIQIAKATNDKVMASEVRRIVSDVKAVIDNPASRMVLETKALAAKRDVMPAIDEGDIDQVYSSDPIGEISGYGSTFNNVDFGGDIVMPGAFRRSLVDWQSDSRLPVMLACHDMRVFPIGVWGTMREDKKGLYVEGKLANTPRGREAWALINMRPAALDGLSIGYSIVESDIDRDGNKLLNEIRLAELSLVSLPMNPRARFTPGRSKSQGTMDIDQALRRARDVALAAMAGEQDGKIIPFPARATSAEPDYTEEAQIVRGLNQLAETLRRA